MRFQVTYSRTMILAQEIEADSEAEANALARDEIAYLKDMDFEEISITHEIKNLLSPPDGFHAASGLVVLDVPLENME